MNRIRLLPEQVANQIAAGEVVERPASVVKELVENALDAQATAITAEIQAGGRSLIRITDNGLGMSRDDALLCLERHATSKIQTAHDLSSITTMGFRGEALPSIASVSRFTLTTREQEPATSEATQVVIHGGKLLEVQAAGAPPGTCAEVRHLFFNLPARRKFLRSEETERVHIQHYLTLAALAFPQVAFTFVQDQTTVWRMPALKAGDGSSRLTALEERMKLLHGGGQDLIRLDAKFSLPAFHEADRPASTAATLHVWGLMGAPGVSRATRDNQYLFVNRRPVENRGLNFALIEGYHTALMKGRFPVCCLFLEIDPGEVDVNVHPAKREVKFHSEKSVRQAVAQAVRQTLLQFHAPLPCRPPESPATQSASPRVGSKPFLPTQSPAAEPRDLPLAQPACPPQPPLASGLPIPPPAFAPASQNQSVSSGIQAKPPLPPGAIPPVSPAPFAPPPPLLSVPLRLVGVLGNLYVLLESDRGLVLLDQHAAHERVLYEQMLRRLEQGGASSQRLLLPETIELPPRDAQFVREQLPALTRLGVGLSEFGERTFLLDALPPFVHAAHPRQFVFDLLDELKAAGQDVNALRLGEQTIAKTVCRHAVKAHDPLAGPELEQLLQDLRQCAMPYTCPHGRPTLIEMSFRELEKKFGRIQ